MLRGGIPHFRRFILLSIGRRVSAKEGRAIHKEMGMNASIVRRSRVLALALCAALLMAGAAAHSASAAKLGPSLVSKLNGLANSSPVGTVIVAFNTSNGLNSGHLATLTLAGITRGYTLQNLGMVAVPATAGQVRALAGNPA